MKFPMMNPLEMVLFVLYLIYVILPIPTPRWLASWVDSSLGMIILFSICVFLFLYSHPLLAVLYVFVAYEMIRRSTLDTGKTTYIQYTSTEAKREKNMKAMNPPPMLSVEEEVIAKMAPAVVNPMDHYQESDFKPLAENIHSAGNAGNLGSPAHPLLL